MKDERHIQKVFNTYDVVELVIKRRKAHLLLWLWMRSKAARAAPRDKLREVRLHVAAPIMGLLGQSIHVGEAPMSTPVKMDAIDDGPDSGLIENGMNNGCLMRTCYAWRRE